MWKLDILWVVALVSVFYFLSIHAGTCEETETAQVKLDLARQSIANAKLLYPKCRKKDEKDSSNCSVKDRSFAHLNAALDLISEAKITCHSCPENKVILPQVKPLDCIDILQNISKKSGVYQIWPKIGGSQSNQSIDVYCDMETDGGGWTVIQRRGKFEKQIDFYQDWETYKNGFGNISEEFWLGNEKLFILTHQKNYSVRFDLVNNEQEYGYAFYKMFIIGNEESGYFLTIGMYSGNTSNDMPFRNIHKFSTKDRRNEVQPKGDSCASEYHSAFWFNAYCTWVNLNGIYQPGVDDKKSVHWFQWTKNREGLYSVEMKIRPYNI